MKKGPNPLIDPIPIKPMFAVIAIGIISLLIKACVGLPTPGLPMHDSTRTALAGDAAPQTLTPDLVATLATNVSPTHISTPLPGYTPTSILADMISDQLVGLIDRYYHCINTARHDVESDYKACWDLLSGYPGEIQDNQNKLHDGKGLESFSKFWGSLKVAYALYPCRKMVNNVPMYFVDVEYVLYSRNDLSVPISDGKKFYVEYSFGLDHNGWRIKAADGGIPGIGSYCLPQPSVERWNPAP